MTEYNFQVKRENTFNGAVFTVIVNTVAQNLTGAIITAEFRRGFRQPLSLLMGIGTGLSIVDAAAGKFQIDSQKINIDPGRYQYEIKIVFPSGVTKTWIYGVMVVNENINDE